MFHHSRLRLEKIGRGAILVREGVKGGKGGGVVEITNTVFHFTFFFSLHIGFDFLSGQKVLLVSYDTLFMLFWVLVVCYFFFLVIGMWVCISVHQFGLVRILPNFHQNHRGMKSKEYAKRQANSLNHWPSIKSVKAELEKNLQNL